MLQGSDTLFWPLGVPIHRWQILTQIDMRTHKQNFKRRRQTLMHAIWNQNAQSVKSKQYAHKETKRPPLLFRIAIILFQYWPKCRQLPHWMKFKDLAKGSSSSLAKINLIQLNSKRIS